MKNRILSRVVASSFALVLLAGVFASSARGDDIPRTIADYPCSKILSLETTETMFNTFRQEFAGDEDLALDMMKAARLQDWPASLMSKVYKIFKDAYGDQVGKILAQSNAQVDWDVEGADMDNLYQGLIAYRHPDTRAAQLARSGSTWDWSPEDVNIAYEGFPTKYDANVRTALAHPAVFLNWNPKDVDANYQGLLRLGYTGELATQLAKVASFVDWNVTDVDAEYKDFASRFSPQEAIELTQVAVIAEGKKLNFDTEQVYGVLRAKFPQNVALAMLKTMSGVGIIVE